MSRAARGKVRCGMCFSAEADPDCDGLCFGCADEAARLVEDHAERTRPPDAEAAEDAARLALLDFVKDAKGRRTGRSDLTTEELDALFPPTEPSRHALGLGRLA